MKPSLSIKTLYRSPIKTLLTFILLAVVTFAYFAVILLSAVICSSLATRRNVLELLQTKE